MRTRFTLVFALAWVLLMGVAAAMTLVLQRQVHQVVADRGNL